MSKSPAKGGIRTDHIKAKELPQAAQEWAEGAAHDAAERVAGKPEVAAPVQPPVSLMPPQTPAKVTKIFQHPPALAVKLRMEAATQSHEKGVRVTERDVVIAALEAYYHHLWIFFFLNWFWGFLFLFAKLKRSAGRGPRGGARAAAGQQTGEGSSEGSSPED